MNTMFLDILQKLISEQGKEALLNPAKCKAFLADYTKGEYKKESRLLLQAIDAGVQKAIDTTGELEVCKRQQIRVLQEEHFLSAEAAEDIVDTLALVLKGEQESGTSPVCSNCGKELQKEWGVCPYCGTPVVKIQQGPPQPETPLAEAPHEQTQGPAPDEQTPSATLTVQPLLNKKKHTKRNLIIAGAVLLVIIFISIINEITSAPAIFPAGFVGTWKRNNSNITLTFTSTTIKASNQDLSWVLKHISGDSYTTYYNNAPSWGRGTTTFKLVNGNLVISGDSGIGEDNWNGTWKAAK